MKWIDRLKAKIIHALGGLTRAEAMFPAPIVQVLHYDIQTVRTVKIVPAFTRTHETEMEKMLRAEIAHNIAEYVMEHDAVVYERQEEENTKSLLTASREAVVHRRAWRSASALRWRRPSTTTLRRS